MPGLMLAQSQCEQKPGHGQPVPRSQGGAESCLSLLMSLRWRLAVRLLAIGQSMPMAAVQAQPR